MILLNFSHPLTRPQVEQVKALAQQEVSQVIDVPSQIDPEQPLVPQVQAMLDGVPLTPEDWQTAPLLVNLPSLNYSAAVVLAELHGRMGYFPAVLRLKPEPDSLPPQFTVAEIINLQAVRDKARRQRT